MSSLLESMISAISSSSSFRIHSTMRMNEGLDAIAILALVERVYDFVLRAIYDI